MTINILEKYNARLDLLQERLHKEILEEHRKFENIGWGAGMRMSKINISFRKSEGTEQQIERLEIKIKTLEFNTIKFI